MSKRSTILILLVLLMTAAASSAQEAADNVSEITVVSPKSNEKVDRQISIAGEVEFAQKPADDWTVFIVIFAPDGNYYFSTWEKEINYEILKVKDVDGKPVARWKVNSIVLGRPGTADVGKSFDLFIVILKESEIQDVVEGVCPRLAETDRCAGTRTAYRELLKGKLAPSAAVSDPITVERR